MNAIRLSRPAIGAAILGVLTLIAACSSSGSSSSQGASSAGASAAASGSSTSSASGTPILVGALNEGSGAAAQPDFAPGIEAAVGYINSIGGVDGHPLKLDLCNVDDSTTATQSCAQKFVQEKPAFVTVGIDNQLAVAYPLLASAGIPLIGGTPVTPEDYSQSDAFFLNGGSLAVGAGTVQFIHEFLPSVKTVGAVGIDIPVAKEAVQAASGLYSAYGVSLKAVYVPVSQQDFLAPMQSIPGMDAYLAYTTTAGCLGIAQAAQSEGIKAAFVGVGPCNDAAVIKSAAGAMTGWYVWALGPDPQSNEPAVVTYRNALAKFGGPGAVVGSDSESTFGDMMTIYETVLKPLGYSKITPAAVKASISNPAGGKTFYGATYKCGQIAKYQAVCNYDTLWFKITNAQGGLTNASNGQFINAATLLGG